MKDSTRYTLIAVGITVPILLIIFIVLMTVLFPSEKPKENNSSIDTSSIINVSSEKEDEDPSSDVQYLYSVPSFVSRNYDSVINDTDYTEKYSFVAEYEYDETFAEGTIIKQSVEEGTPISENGTEIVLTISMGSKFREMPELVDKNIDYAKETLNDMYIRYVVETKEGVYGDSEKVAEMSIAAGTVIDISQNPTVTLYVYEVEPEEESSSEPDTDWVNELE